MTPQPVGAHLGTDALADLVAGVGSDTDAAHAAGCEQCGSALTHLRAASAGVTRQLAEIPDPDLPPVYAQRFTDALAREAARRAQDHEPATAARPDRPRRASWWERLPRLRTALVAAAAVLVVGGGGTLALSRALNDTDGGEPDLTGAAPALTATATPDAGGRSRLATPPNTGPPNLAPGNDVALHRDGLADQAADLLTARRVHTLDPVPVCVRTALAGTADEGSALTTVRGTFRLDGDPVRLVFADDERVAIVISGCAVGDSPAVAARADVTR